MTDAARAALLTLVLAAAPAGCGLKGELYLPPPESADAPAAPEDEPPPRPGSAP